MYYGLEEKSVPEMLKVKSKWMSFLVITFGILIMTTCAVTIGTIFGYTYCYIERHCIKPVNHTHQASFQTIWSHVDSEEAKYNRTINGAIMSSVLVSKIMDIGHKLLNKTTGPHTLINDTARQAYDIGTLLYTVGQTEPNTNDSGTIW